MIPTEKAHLLVAAATDPGMKGKNNEDQFAVSAFKVSEKDPTPSVFAMVADGIGGHRSGEVASDIAVEIDSTNPASPMGRSVIGMKMVSKRTGDCPAATAG